MEGEQETRELNVTLLWGRDNISLSRPEGWHLNGILSPGL